MLLEEIAEAAYQYYFVGLSAKAVPRKYASVTQLSQTYSYLHSKESCHLQFFWTAEPWGELPLQSTSSMHHLPCNDA